MRICARPLSRADAERKPLCVLLFDIDHFKAINDAFGHDAGDDVLTGFAERLRYGVRGIDLVSRYGGEEFLLVMPDTDAEYAASVAERLRSDVEKLPFPTSLGDEIPVTVSIGIAEWNGRSDTPTRSSSAPTARSTRPSAPAATAWWRARPELRLQLSWPDEVLVADAGWSATVQMPCIEPSAMIS